MAAPGRACLQEAGVPVCTNSKQDMLLMGGELCLRAIVGR